MATENTILKSREDIPVLKSDAFDDDHALLRAARRQAPLARGRLDVVFALRRKHLDYIMNAQNTRQLEMETMALQGVSEGPLFDVYQAAMLFANGDAHKRRRTPVARAFAFKLMDALRPEIASVASELIRSCERNTPFSFLDEIASVIPARMIGRIIGAPASEVHDLAQWTYSAIRGLGLHDRR